MHHEQDARDNDTSQVPEIDSNTCPSQAQETEVVPVKRAGQMKEVILKEK